MEKEKTDQHNFCNEHTTLITNVASIKTTVEHVEQDLSGSFKKINNHIKDGNKWRLGIIMVAVTIVIQIVVFAYTYGVLTHTVSTLAKSVDEIWDRIETHGKLPTP